MGLPAPPPEDLHVSGDKPYVQYEKQLAAGAVGVIWLARLADGLELGRLVSVRRIPEQLVTDQTRERLRQTARACLGLRHPSLLKLLAIREADGEVLSVSEHLQGVLLYELKRHLMETQTPLPIPVSVRIIRDAARAGAEVHGLANGHRVFQEQRLLYNYSIHVAAFGETLLRDVGVLTELCRTPAFMEIPGVIAGLSPEELSGPRVTQESSEVFSLGILLWELLANRPIFSQRDAQKATSGVISQPIPPLDRVDRIGMPLPKNLVDLVARAIDRDPRRRTPNLETFADEIDEFAASLVGTTDQVGGCIRRLAGGFLGEVEQSSRWSVGAESDFFARESGVGVPSSTRGQAFEPETIADRQILARSLLELRHRREQEEGTDALDVEVVFEPRRRNRRVSGAILALLVAVAVAVAVVVGLSQSGQFRAGLMSARPGGVLRSSPRPYSNRVWVKPSESVPVIRQEKQAEVFETPQVGSVSPDPVAPERASADSPPTVPSAIKPVKGGEPSKYRRSIVKPNGAKAKPTELVPEERWGI